METEMECVLRKLLDSARETNRRLNRRCQKVESLLEWYKAHRDDFQSRAEIAESQVDDLRKKIVWLEERAVELEARWR